MSRYIDADKLIQQIEADSKGNEGQYGDDWKFMDTIRSQPTADVVEVVRCKDCKWWDNDGDAERCTHKYGGMWAKSDGYCSYGEREK